MTTLRCAVDVSLDADTSAWSVSITCAERPEAFITKRSMRRLADPNGASPAFPLPASPGAQPGDIHYALCAASHASEIARVFERIRTRDADPDQQDIRAFGRYLFDCLLGEEAWGSIRTFAARRPIELALRLQPEAWELSRLPWELMARADAGAPDGTRFLAGEQEQTVGITRVVLGAAQSPAKVPLPLKVLFVVGTDLDDEVIRPGAEYLLLLRRLQACGSEFALNTRLIVEASSANVQDEIARFGPAVVHFICHGHIDEETGEGRLGLRSDDGAEPAYLDSEQLLLMLQTQRPLPLPAVVVLNACDSGTTAADQNRALAEKLVLGGVPIVVGMAGEVADAACRLFTRCFYEALVEGTSLSDATAIGRRQGLITLGDLNRSMDWALPTIFIAEGAAPQLDIHRDAYAMAAPEIARGFLTKRNPRILCGRLPILEQQYRKLINPQPNASKRVLALRVVERAQMRQEPQYGKTRMLEELAAQAVRDGYVPCLVRSQTPPVNILELGLALLEAMLETRKHFGLNLAPQSQLLQRAEDRAQLPKSPPSDNPALDYKLRLQDLLVSLSALPAERKSWATPSIVRGLLQLDLAALANEVAEKYNLPDTLVLVLFDEVHRYDTAAEALLQMLDKHGLGAPGERMPGGLSYTSRPVPVVIAFSNNQPNPAYAGAISALTAFLTEKRDYVELSDLGRLPSPTKNALPYTQFLLHFDPPVTFKRSAQTEDILKFYTRLEEKVQGVPSRLERSDANDDVMAAIEVATDWLMEEADDRTLVQLAQVQHGR